MSFDPDTAVYLFSLVGGVLYATFRASRVLRRIEKKLDSLPCVTPPRSCPPKKAIITPLQDGGISATLSVSNSEEP